MTQTNSEESVLAHLAVKSRVDGNEKKFTCWLWQIPGPQMIFAAFLSPPLVLLPICVGLIFIQLSCNLIDHRQNHTESRRTSLPRKWN